MMMKRYLVEPNVFVPDTMLGRFLRIARVTNPALRLDNLGKFGSAKVMNEWAARFLSVFPERNKADLDEFIQQVRACFDDHVSRSRNNLHFNFAGKQ